MDFQRNEEKNRQLQQQRGVGFEDVLVAIQEDRVVYQGRHPNTKRSPHQEAKEIEQMIRSGEYVSEDVEAFTSMMQKAIRERKKKQKIHIGLNQHTLSRIKAISLQEGLPYQTFINSILTKFVRDYSHHEK